MLRRGLDDFVANTPIQRLSPESVQFVADDIGWQALGPAIACTVLATAIVAVRWYTRCRLAHCLGKDDYVILLSLAISWAMTGVIAVEVDRGIGVYGSLTPMSSVTELIVAANVLWIVTVNITKASILTQYLRIFGSPVIRTCCYVLMVLLVPAASWAILGGTLLCSPVARLWKPEIPGRCMNAQTYWLSVAGIDIGLDFVVLMLPMPAVVTLRLPRKQKFTLLLVCFFGFSVCVFSAIRLVMVKVTADQGDYIVSGIWSIIWSTVEANVGIICASLLALKPLLVQFFPALMVETEPPRHCMRLPTVETRRTWLPFDSDDATLGEPATRTTTLVSKYGTSSGTTSTPGFSYPPPVLSSFSRGDSNFVQSEPPNDTRTQITEDACTFKEMLHRRREGEK